jgi:hypothetical protein
MKIYLEHVREGLAELASDELQHRRWLASGGPEVSSFDEAVAQLYDDSGLSDVLDTPAASEMLGAPAAELLRELAAMLPSVNRRLAVDALIESPQMASVRSLAAAAHDALR